MQRTLVLIGLLIFAVGGAGISAQQSSQSEDSSGLTNESTGSGGYSAGTQPPPPSAIGTTRDSSGSGKSSSGGSGSSISIPDYFYKHLTGTIGGKYRIVMNLTRLGSALIGDYYYANQGIPLFFGYGSTISKDGTIHLVETNQLEPTGSNDITGTFDGRFVGKNEVRGSWTKKGSDSSLPFAVSTVGLTGGAFDAEHDERAYYDHSHASAKMDVTFPVLRSTSAEADAAFNSNVLSTVVGLYENGVSSVPPTSVAQALGDFIDAFTAQLADGGSRSYFPPWSYSITAQVLFDSNNIVSLRYEAFSFEGGAHPNTVYKNASYQTTTGSVIALSDLLKSGYERQLNEIGLEEFRKQHGIKEGESLAQAGYSVGSQGFKLNKNYIITKAGLLFQFNQYEIAPYYFGAQQVLIPYSKLKQLLRPKSPISELVSQSNRDSSVSVP